jgi:Asp-tRNA(Asn)/Glu-tRNA(Gln) amidotransferase A subunit family amidase
LSGGHGLAVTFGRIPFGMHLDSVLIKAGPITATSADAAIAYAALAPNQPESFYNVLYDGDVHGPPHPTLQGLNDITDLSDVRLGMYSEWFNDSDPQVRDRCHVGVS